MAVWLSKSYKTAHPSLPASSLCPASVFDLIPKEDIRKMEAVKEAAKMAASRFQSAGSQSQDSDPVPPRTEASSGQSSSQVAETPGAPVGGREQAPLFSGGVGVKPFRNDPAKQDRYDRYLLLVKQGVQGNVGRIDLFFPVFDFWLGILFY